MKQKEINNKLEKLKNSQQKQIDKLNLSANPNDWIMASALENVKHGVEIARQNLINK